MSTHTDTPVTEIAALKLCATAEAAAQSITATPGDYFTIRVTGDEGEPPLPLAHEVDGWMPHKTYSAVCALVASLAQECRADLTDCDGKLVPDVAPPPMLLFRPGGLVDGYRGITDALGKMLYAYALQDAHLRVKEAALYQTVAQAVLRTARSEPQPDGYDYPTLAPIIKARDELLARFKPEMLVLFGLLASKHPDTPLTKMVADVLDRFGFWQKGGGLRYSKDDFAVPVETL